MTDRPAPAPRTARALARETLTRDIVGAARARLAQDGPAALSLRAVARDVGMVSSAVYRYFPSRDALLTALLVECYDELGAAVEDAEAAQREHGLAARWLAACRAVRTWSVAHPGEFSLLYGTPVPGYAAPRDTVVPATRVVRVLVRVAADAHDAGARPVAPAAWPGVDAPVETVVARAREYVAAEGLFPGRAPGETTLRVLMAWSTLFGAVSFELFGHLVGSVDDGAAWFDAVAVRLGADLGMAPAGAGDGGDAAPGRRGR
ncbi:TetR/AcrR family transcriptional regulator [Isoptericola sp. BMS4]|uniref:TetR/AcrR family transcriptional regulator n=1 Tax=Isoptericola sp. BMS4 TaxID=2527875 RepID=UPI00141E0A25|nr:TetR/AcrR family transcriptional regulator [Isoptericola sp. BMS4]